MHMDHQYFLIKWKGGPQIYLIKQNPHTVWRIIEFYFPHIGAYGFYNTVTKDIANYIFQFQYKSNLNK